MGREFYVTIEGATQGKLKGEGTSAGHKDQLAGLAFDYEVSSPRDLETGQASGKVQHKPITFTKAWGAASPQLYQALITKEELKSVVFEFMHSDAQGQEVVYQTIQLSGAAISGIRQQKDLAGTIETPELEEVDLVYRQITIENKDGNTSVTDDWKQG